jgi:hypothetical protein
MVLLALNVSADSVELIHPYFMDFGGTLEQIKVIYNNTEGIVYTNLTGRVVFSFEGGSSTNMTYVNITKHWEVFVSESSTEGETTFYISAYNDINQSNATLAVNQSGIMRFFQPFNLTFRLFKGSTSNTTATVEPYRNEFQYVFVQRFNDSKNQLPDFGDLDRLFSKMPFYGTFGKRYIFPIDQTVSHWAKYENGQVTIKLYRAEKYNVFVTAVGRTGEVWPHEFIRPQFQDTRYTSKLFDINILNETSSANDFDIYISAYEISKFNFWLNFAKNAFFFMIWIGLVAIISMINPKAGGAIAIVTMPFLFALLGVKV